MSNVKLGEVFSLNSSAPLFIELWDLYVGFISLSAVLLLELKDREARAKFRALRERGNDVGEKRTALDDDTLIHFTPLFMRKPDCDDVLFIADAPALVNHIAKPRQPRPSALSFQLIPKQAWSSLHIEPTIEGTNQPSYLESIWGHVLATAYERNQAAIKHVYKNDCKKWPPELQFFRQIRNGVFHGGTFDIWANTIEPSSPPRWRTYVMPSESSMNGRAVFNDFLKLPHVPLLIHDMSLALAKCSRSGVAGQST